MDLLIYLMFIPVVSVLGKNCKKVDFLWELWLFSIFSLHLALKLLVQCESLMFARPLNVTLYMHVYFKFIRKLGIIHRGGFKRLYSTWKYC